MKPSDSIYPMLLADAGNTCVKFALLTRPHGQPRKIDLVPTEKLTTANIRSLRKKSPAVTFAAVSVVPAATEMLRRACPDVFLVTPSSALNFATIVDRRTVGADRVVNMAEAKRRFGKNVLVADFGTAATFDVLDSRGRHAGGAIAPGLHTLAATLTAKTAQLPSAVLRKPKRFAGRHTAEALSSGVAGGYAGMVRHLIDQLAAECCGRIPPRLVFTGGDAALVARLTGLQPQVDRDWTLRGLAVLAEAAAREVSKQAPRACQPASRG